MQSVLSSQLNQNWSVSTSFGKTPQIYKFTKIYCFLGCFMVEGIVIGIPLGHKCTQKGVKFSIPKTPMDDNNPYYNTFLKPDQHLNCNITTLLTLSVAIWNNRQSHTCMFPDC
jgi:hypothetical protein